MQSPWTEIGRLQSEVRELKNSNRGKVDSHEIHRINHRLDRIENSLHELKKLHDKLSTMENRLEELTSE